MTNVTFDSNYIGSTMTNVTFDSNKERSNLTIFLAVIFLLVSIDIGMDIASGLPFKGMVLDFVLEGSILLTIGLMAMYIWRKFMFERENRLKTTQSLKQKETEVNYWSNKSRDYVKQFQEDILGRFDEWQLSKSEKEIGFYLLQGKTSKEIATIRSTSERTVRNQCKTIYDKTGVSGKSELVALIFHEMLEGMDSIVQN